jgi:hypothetical protein
MPAFCTNTSSKGYAQGINYAGLKINPVNLVNIGDYQDIDPMTGKPRMSVGFIILFSIAPFANFPSLGSLVEMPIVVTTVFASSCL